MQFFLDFLQSGQEWVLLGSKNIPSKNVADTRGHVDAGTLRTSLWDGRQYSSPDASTLYPFSPEP